jgi:transposase
MPFPLTDDQRSELDAAMTAEKRARRRKRYRAIMLRGEGLSVPAVARTLGCSQASIYAWSAAWRQEGVAGLAEGAHRGGPIKLGPAAEAMLTALLASDPQAQGHRATGWTVPLLQGELAARGTVVGERTIRRALHRLGYRWKRPRYILGRPDPAYAAKKGR